MTTTHRMCTAVLGTALGLAVAAGARPAMAKQVASASEPERVGVLDAAIESLTGDVYADPQRWRPLSITTLFTEGWDQAWVSPPNGPGGAPRQGWLNAFDGVFYRLGIFTYGFARDFADDGNRNIAGATVYLPFSRRFEFRLDVPYLQNQKVLGDYETAAGDMQVVPRVLLGETESFTHSFQLSFRVPTGNEDMGNHVAALVPGWDFWSNCWRGLVVRGGVAMSVPYSHVATREVGARNAFLGNLAVGYYFTDHDLTPVGDLVGYLATNLEQLTDHHGANTTTLTLTPGFRSHLGRNWYLLGGIEVPVTSPNAYDFQLLGGLMKVF